MLAWPIKSSPNGQVPLDASLVTVISDVSDTVANALPSAVAPLETGFRRFEVEFDSEINLFDLGIRVGSVIEYLDIAGELQRATIDHLTLNTFCLLYTSDAADDSLRVDLGG